MHSIGLVAVDTTGKWIGGRYYLQHLVKAVKALPESERPSLADVWWQEAPADDPFEEVRGDLDRQVIVRTPKTILGRMKRKVRRIAGQSRDAGDLFKAAGVGVLFPLLPCATPGIPYVFWLPDFQYLHLPQLFTKELSNWLDEHYRANVSKADLVVLSSQHALRDFNNMFPEHRGKARVVHFCSVPDESWWRLNPSDTALKRGLDRPFFLLSNQFSLHKNHAVVFEAVRILKSRGVSVDVVCTGNTYCFQNDGYFAQMEEFVRIHGLQSQIHILGMIPREEQVALMRRAIGMLQPSRFEGWSTIVEDAKTLGKTLLVSDIEVHREQLGDDHGYLDVDNAEEWANAMGDVWNSCELGPDYSAEREALLRMKSNQAVYGLNFIKVMREAMGK
jgi:glycosyltransferase involved in cell wall biosynthesis